MPIPLSFILLQGYQAPTCRTGSPEIPYLLYSYHNLTRIFRKNSGCFSRDCILFKFLPDSVTDCLRHISPPMVLEMAEVSQGKLPHMGLIAQVSPIAPLGAFGQGLVLLKPPLVVGLEQLGLVVVGEDRVCMQPCRLVVILAPCLLQPMYHYCKGRALKLSFFRLSEAV